MRLRVGAGACCLLPVLVLLTVRNVDANQPQERRYYIAAVEIDWNYSGSDTNGAGPTYKKMVFREYDKDFRQAKSHPSWLGLLGPTLRAEEGETIVVTFRNMASSSCSIHPHGVAYGKQSEGAHYFDNTSQKEKEDDTVYPNSEHVYYWEVTSDVAPQENDPTCLTYTYISHQNVVMDYNSGLIGTLLICKPGSLDESGQQVGIHHEFVFLFGVFDENQSKYEPNGYASDNHVKYTINGYTKGSLPNISMCAHASVRLHLVGMSSESEVFSVHIQAGMHAFVDVMNCDGFEKPNRWMTIAQRRQSREWKYYIAAEEIVWDYAPTTQDHIDEDFKRQYLSQSATRIGGKYKKVVYTQYKDETFTERSESQQRKNELGILGPVIRAQIRDVITIVFKNKASRPYSIYPHGLTIEKSQEGVNYPEGGNHSHGVQPGETHTYVWKVLEEDEPLEEDARCLTRLYHSAVNTPRDIASGLIGPMLICKSQSLNVRNVQLKADKEQHAVFAVFDENKSWYLEDNIRQYCDRSKVNREDPEFYKSNIKHTINGYVFKNNPPLGFCNGEVATWHVSSIGAQDYIQTATFYGHTFELNERTEDFLSLYPMTGETITMKMLNTGVWLLASLSSHETTKGMRIKFQDVECFRDYQYEYEDGSSPNEFNVWKPPSFNDIKETKKKEPEPVKATAVDPDIDTDMFAEELGLRSLKNQSTDSDMERLDLSFLDYGAVNVLDRDMNNTLDFKETKSEPETATTKPDALNQIWFLMWKVLNITAAYLQDQSATENATHVQNSSTPSTQSASDNSTLYQAGNPTVLNSHNVSLQNYSTTGNGSASDNVTVSGTKNATLHKTTASSMTGNTAAETTHLTIALQEPTNLTAALPGNSSYILERERVNVTVTVDIEEMVPDFEEKHTRGDVFSYSVPLSEPGINSLNNSLNSSLSADTLLDSAKVEDENNTAIKHINISAEGTNHLLSVPEADAQEVSSSSTERNNLTDLELVDSVDNKTSDNNTFVSAEELEYKLQISLEVVPTNSSLENVTHILLENEQNVTVNASRSDLSGMSSMERDENVTALLDKFTNTSLGSLSNDTVVSANLSLFGVTVKSTSSEERYSSESSEVLIYLKENHTEAIKTTLVKLQGHNWTYEGIYQTVPEEMPDHMKKFFEKGTLPQTTAPPKKKRRTVIRRQRPEQGHGMKTRRKKEYKPQARTGLPFSPRGFNPGMTPRGSRPHTPQSEVDEDHLINMPVVIGVPRPDFSDYELYIPGEEPDHLGLEKQDINANEYEYVMYKDPYSDREDIKNLNLDETTKYYLQMFGSNIKAYFIAAEEVQWDYAGYGHRRQEKSELISRETKFTKVVFRGYMDSSFQTPDIRGEIEEHLGILGPVIKAEVGQSIMVVFRNNANRPYSIHPNGVSYTKRTEGLSYEDDSTYWFKYDNEVQPNSTFTYLWKVEHAVGPKPEESDCRTWAYYSGVNPERDIHSGLIGPLLVCREGTLDKTLTNTREFTLLFMTFDESQSWYYEKNRDIMQRKRRRKIMDPNLKENLKFHSINGIVHSLKGLRMYTNQLVTWHLINMGSPTDFHSVHFHGQTFIHKKTTSYRQAVYPLLPGGFATLEMYPSKPGLWQLETEVGFNQQKGMQTLFLVLDNDCYRPLGLESGSVKDNQITAVNTRGYWEPHLARLNNQGKYNAWSTEKNNSFIQVDFQRPVVISQVATQGAKQMFYSQYVVKYLISYSNDRRSWIFYKGDSKGYRKVFTGNQDAYEKQINTFFPPMVGRFIRLHPIEWYNMATVRMEFYGCELDGCSVPLGMESEDILNDSITASSTATSWYAGPWKPSLARLNRQGAINAWRAKNNDMNQWLQVELPHIKKITGIITQGAKSLGKEMYVISYTLQYSDDGTEWKDYTDNEDEPAKVFLGNTNNNDHLKNYIYPPIFSRFIRIIPKSWMNSITMRIELLGCDFE
ncbi:coagulation factor V isoform X2 [Archocentrus centrarchus]|uniref:coagulation factor V isoform X2 n=1 Tax=Archocentrus centrarchus TaxID=63155 RepID=UPI0011EA0A2A|nr:coagulation factor V-like isoform X2 [Archocentrus centrarchus]